MTFLVLLAAKSDLSHCSWGDPAAQPAVVPGRLTERAFRVEIHNVPIASGNVVAVVALAVRVGGGRPEVGVVVVKRVEATGTPVMVSWHWTGSGLDGILPNRCRSSC